MSETDALRQISSSRPGFTAVAAVPVALPLWRLRLRVEILARRDISPLEQFILRAALDVDPKLGTIQQLLGLDDDTFQDALAAVVAREWARVDPGARLVFTEAGKRAAETAQMARSEERVITVEYDGLLRTPTLADLPLVPAQRRSLGLHELPANPPTAPDLVQLRDTTDALQAIIRSLGDGRDQEVDLLAVKGVLRRDRIFREATLVIFRSESEGVQAAPVIGGLVSNAHEQALAAPAVVRQLRLATELRRGRRFHQLLPAYLRDLYDPKAQAAAQALQSGDDSQANGAEADERRAAAAAALRALPVRHLAPYEHTPLLNAALRSAKERLLIVSAVISPVVVDRDLLAAMRGRLEAGVDVSIGYRHTPDLVLPSAILDLANDYSGLTLRPLKDVPAATLIRDNDLAVHTLFPLLASRGIERPFRDERGWLVNGVRLVEAFTTEIEAALAEASIPSP